MTEGGLRQPPFVVSLLVIQGGYKNRLDIQPSASRSARGLPSERLAHELSLTATERFVDRNANPSYYQEGLTKRGRGKLAPP
jgi:hypothetical protein